jgi:hypothetical protein
MKVGDLVIYKPEVAKSYGGPKEGGVGLIVKISESTHNLQSDYTKILIRWPDGREWYMAESWLDVVSESA